MFVSPPESPKRGTDGSSSMGTRGFRILSGLPFLLLMLTCADCLAASLPHLCHRSLLHRQRSNGIGGEQHLFHKASSSKIFGRACDPHPKFFTWQVVVRRHPPNLNYCTLISMPLMHPHPPDPICATSIILLPRPLHEHVFFWHVDGQ